MRDRATRSCATASDGSSCERPDARDHRPRARGVRRARRDRRATASGSGSSRTTPAARSSTSRPRIDDDLGLPDLAFVRFDDVRVVDELPPPSARSAASSRPIDLGRRHVEPDAAANTRCSSRGSTSSSPPASATRSTSPAGSRSTPRPIRTRSSPRSTRLNPGAARGGVRVRRRAAGRRGRVGVAGVVPARRRARGRDATHQGHRRRRGDAARRARRTAPRT